MEFKAYEPTPKGCQQDSNLSEDSDSDVEVSEPKRRKMHEQTPNEAQEETFEVMFKTFVDTELAGYSQDDMMNFSCLGKLAGILGTSSATIYLRSTEARGALSKIRSILNSGA
jgi:hypothetical protein